MSSTRLSTRRQLELMQQLQQAADERAALEASIAESLRSEMAAAEEDKSATAQKLDKAYSQRRRDLENEYAEAKSAACGQCRQAQEELQHRSNQEHARIEKDYRQTVLSIERKKKESEWQALAVFDASKDVPQQMLDEAAKRLHARMLQVEGLERDAYTLLAMRRLTKMAESGELPTESPAADDNDTGSAEDRLQQAVSRLHHAVLDLQSQRLPSLLLEGIRPIGWWVFACVLAIVPAGFLADWSIWLCPPIALVLGTVVAAIAHLTLGRRARQQSLDQFAWIKNLLHRSRTLEQNARDEAKALSREKAEAIALAKHQDLAAAQDVRDRAIAEAETRRDEALRRDQTELDEAVEKAKKRRVELLAAADEQFPPLLDQLAEERRRAVAENDNRFQQRTAKAQQTYDAAWTAMAENWKTRFQAVADELADMCALSEQLFPDWSVTNWDQWSRPKEPPEAMQFGSYQLPLQAVKNGVSADERLVPEQRHLELPALMTFAEQPRLVISASGAGCAAAVDMLQAMMLRFLTAMPAGKLRFTIIDPSALGENFATFMHLADYDEQLVGGRIWTDSRQIDERLRLLSEHMEKVLQKYLRNEFETIHQYNQQAGEVSEPYHVLVVANFPAGLSDASIRKLMTIATTGPRCGVYTLLSIDEQLKLPNELNLQELLNDAVHLRWQKDRLVWQYPLYEKLDLQLDRLPPRERLNDLLRQAGQESREASRVEVPFAVVAPGDDQIWCSDSAYELVVPVGRAGANELQSIRLGRGTSQHALIAGKTGSGKSTLLHALITNAALHYSPRELEFYLVDFKKGVEFKPYATGQLPHARVIAIESEREFGVSVLERLDEELRRRGQLFRELGVQDLAGYREKMSGDGGQRSGIEPRGTNGQETSALCSATSDARPLPSDLSDPMPRVLLIVDEFQELFVTDDKLSQDAALLLDRLVRQGRAFGIHVLLGSQTLAGAYSLARSTLGQMAVRIALECSDADAHLILSDENTAARLLSRPGEAIYNDQNGLLEGNRSFQVVWLPDEGRQQYLGTIRQHHDAQGFASEPPIVFEGNVPSDPRENEALVATIENAGAEDVLEPTIWLGSAVRIEPPTHITLRNQGGNHLLVVGHDEPLAVGILSTAIVALAAGQQGNTPSAITVLDGTRPESSEPEVWQTLADALPGSMEVFGPRETANILRAFSDEVARRNKSPDRQHAPRFLVIHDLAQFRELRQSEDDFSFSSSLRSSGTNGKALPIDKQFRNLLREGPEVGLHVLMWCDSYNSLTRVVDRLALRELDYRVALQMSSADSTSLIDSPAAGRLGEYRAILYRDDLGTQVKFRPYGRPAPEWIAWVEEQLARVKLARS